MALTKNNRSHSQLSFKLETNMHCDLRYCSLTGKQRERNTGKKLSRSYNLIMSIFSSFHVFAVMKILVTIRR